MCRLGQHLVIFRMIADPKPNKTFRYFNCKRTVIETYADRIVFAHFLEMQRGMLRIRFEEFKILVR